MFFFQPSWLQHGEEGKPSQPVFSVDIQAVGGRLATAGQDCRIRLWSCEALVQAGSLEAAEQNKNNEGEKKVLVTKTVENSEESGGPKKIPKGALLAVLTYHAGAVNCVRFSPDGSLLASGGDDSVVLTYEKLSGSGRSAAFGSGEGECIENWRCRKPLRAHTGDVTDLSWSSDSDHFCSASVDNTIFVWTAKSEKALKKLEGHKGLVKGVAWDPLGKYVASQSDDKTVIIWRISDWKIEKRITAPFTEAVLHENALAFFLRLSWSPCGTYLLCTNSYSQKTSTHLAPLFSRESGLSEHIDFIGHKEPVVATRFSPRLYSETPTKEDDQIPSSKNPAYTCIALGSKDRGATVWRAGQSRPFVNLQDMFSGDVVDIAWGADGYTLVACSTDGGIMLIRFEPKELGYVVPPNVEEKLYKELSQGFGGSQSSKPLPESKVQVEMEIAEVGENSAQATTLADKSAPPPLAAGGGGGGAEKPPPGAEAVKAAAPVRKSDAQKVILLDQNPAAASRNGGEAGAVSSVPATAGAAPAPVVMRIEPRGQREERVKGGKRRIIPQAIGDGGDGATAVISLESNDVQTPAGNIISAASQSSNPPVFPREVSMEARQAAKRSRVQEMTPWVADPKQQNLLPASNRRGAAKCRAIDNESPPLVLEASLQGSTKSTLLTCARSGSVIWRDYIGAPVVAMAGIDGKFAAVTTVDAFLYLYSAVSGRRLSAPVSLDAPPHIFEMFRRGDNEHMLLIVARSAMVSLYSLEKQELIVSSSAAPLLVRIAEGDEDESTAMGEDTKERIRRGVSVATLSELSEPILVLSDGHAFIHNKKMGSWLRVADDHAPNSEFYRLLPPPGDDSLLSRLQAGAALTARKKGTAMLPSGGLRRSAIEGIGHLETLMEASVALGSGDQYKHYLKCYALRLGSDESVVDCGEERLREICQFLSEGGEILGMSKWDLLDGTVFPAVSRTRRHQRIVEEFTVLLKEFRHRKGRQMENGGQEESIPD